MCCRDYLKIDGIEASDGRAMRPVRKSMKKVLPICCAAQDARKSVSRNLLSLSRMFDDGCRRMAARQFQKNSKSVILMKY
jgi:hypothetical protein